MKSNMILSIENQYYVFGGKAVGITELARGSLKFTNQGFCF